MQLCRIGTDKLLNAAHNPLQISRGQPPPNRDADEGLLEDVQQGKWGDEGYDGGVLIIPSMHLADHYTSLTHESNEIPLVGDLQ